MEIKQVVFGTMDDNEQQKKTGNEVASKNNWK